MSYIRVCNVDFSPSVGCPPGEISVIDLDGYITAMYSESLTISLESFMTFDPNIAGQIFAYSTGTVLLGMTLGAAIHLIRKVR